MFCITWFGNSLDCTFEDTSSQSIFVQGTWMFLISNMPKTKSAIFFFYGAFNYFWKIWIAFRVHSLQHAKLPAVIFLVCICFSYHLFLASYSSHIVYYSPFIAWLGHRNIISEPVIACLPTYASWLLHAILSLAQNFLQPHCLTKTVKLFSKHSSFAKYYLIFYFMAAQMFCEPSPPFAFYFI